VVGIGRLNHVAIAVTDMAQASALYRDILGAEVSEPVVFYFILFYFILFYFILVYFILFYFIFSLF
jgi:catechol 2,3-dioxygenase-like lactoylglutathione lyase family enzyme